jgi:hypothetical protein
MSSFEGSVGRFVFVLSVVIYWVDFLWLKFV